MPITTPNKYPFGTLHSPNRPIYNKTMEALLPAPAKAAQLTPNGMPMKVAELEEIREIFALSRSEMADLLGRRAQSIIEWEVRGIPQEMRATVERLLDLAQVFRKRVIASRIPEIVRTPDSWLGNKTILETLRADGVDPIYAYLGRLFNYTS